MPHQSLKLLPGVDQNKTPALNEAAISESQLIRFIPDRTIGGLVQKLGGWTKYFSSQIGSIVRCLWGWEDTNANSYLGVGAEGQGPFTVTNATGDGTTVTLTHAANFTFTVGYAITVSGINPSAYNGTYLVTNSTPTTVEYASATTTAYVSGGLIAGGGGALEVIIGSGIQDITPQTTIDNVVPDFSTTAGSDVVTVVDANYETTNYDVVYIKTQVSVGGLILFGQYQVTKVTSSSYNIYARDVFGEPELATSTVANGGAVPVFTLQSGSDFVNVELANHGYSVGDTFPVLVATSAGGVTLYGNYQVLTVVDADNFTISASNVAGTIAVTGASGTGATATITYSAAVTFEIGDNVVVTGINPAGYNAAATLTGATAGSISYANATTSAYVSGGTISGSYSVEQNGGNVYLLYYNGLGPSPVASGYGVGPYGAGAYGSGLSSLQGAGQPINAVDWTLDNWGEVFISNPLNGPIYQWSPTSGNVVANVIANAPPVNQGMFVAMPQRQIIAWGSTFTGVSDPMLIRWCDVNDYTTWIASIVNQAGSYRIPKGSRIVQCIQGPQQGLIWTDLGAWAMQYVGPPYVYQFNELGTGCGLIGRKAAGSLGGVVYWMGPSQFFRLAGGGVEPIRCPVWDIVFQDLDTTNLDKIRIAPNSRFGEITWYFPTVSNGGENEGYVKYNVVLDQWDYGFNTAQNPYVARSAWINESVLGPPIGAGLNTYIFQHETSPDADGTAMFSSFQTGYFVLSEADVKMFIDQVWPDMKWGYYGGTQGANILLTFYVTDFAGQTPIAYGPYTLTQATTYITPRFRGRLVSIKIESNDIDSWWRLGNFRYRLQPDGRF
jgi:hypothetical protein